MTFADGIPREMNALTVQVPVKIIDRVVSSEFIVLPELTNNKTLLGADFSLSLPKSRRSRRPFSAPRTRSRCGPARKRA